ncbi:MAG: nuclear transport factor 2 family protein, partial [Thermoleophilia bacterium]|nr:nuclear transport factor 2 family protein [Thermoleophilia bacterium]
WAETWERAWAAHDADAVASLYAEDAAFVSQPFREPHAGATGVRAYAEWAFESEDSVECRFGEPRASDDGATVEYWAWINEDGVEQTLAGVALVRFDGAGKVVEQRDYWAVERGRHAPPPGWGR